MVLLSKEYYNIAINVKGKPNTEAYQYSIIFSFYYNRYLQPPNTWLTATLESRQLLSICLKRIKGLNKIHLVDAGFIWTEPHSKRIKVKLTVQKDVNIILLLTFASFFFFKYIIFQVNGAMLQQTTVIEFTVVNQICADCQRVEAKDYWKAVVQVRQRVS